MPFTVCFFICAYPILRKGRILKHIAHYQADACRCQFLFMYLKFIVFNTIYILIFIKCKSASQFTRRWKIAFLLSLQIRFLVLQWYRQFKAILKKIAYELQCEEIGKIYAIDIVDIVWRDNLTALFWSIVVLHDDNIIIKTVLYEATVYLVINMVIYTLYVEMYLLSIDVLQFWQKKNCYIYMYVIKKLCNSNQLTSWPTFIKFILNKTTSEVSKNHLSSENFIKSNTKHMYDLYNKILSNYLPNDAINLNFYNY